MDDKDGGDRQSPSGGNDPSKPWQYDQVDQQMQAIRSGDLAPYERGEPPAPLADATAITTGRELPSAELTAIMDRYRHVDPIEAMIPVLQEIQVKYGYVTQRAVEQMAAELGISET